LGPKEGQILQVALSTKRKENKTNRACKLKKGLHVPTARDTTTGASARGKELQKIKTKKTSNANGKKT